MSSADELVMCKGKTLRERVKDILKQRHPFSFSAKIHSPKEKLKSSTLGKDGLLQEDHPLKLRVRAAIQHRFPDPCVLSPSREVSGVPLPPPSGSVASPGEEEEEEEGTKTGFDLFLRVLNKGADANLKNMVPDVPPSSQSVTTPPTDSLVKKGCERSLQVFHRGKDASLNDMAPDVPLPPPSQSVASSTEKNPSADEGFERFLKLLNKGVDVQLLRRIVNEDVEDLQNVPPSSKRSKLDPPLRSKSQGLNSEASLPGCSRTSSTESRTDLLRREPSFPDAKEKSSNKNNQNVGSGNQSAFSMSERKEEPKGTLNLDQKHEQLQNIVKTLGLNLDTEELNQLTDRTQERLYGKRSEGSQRTDSRGEKQSQHMSSHRAGSRSSCSSTPRSHSRSLSRSPYRRRSHCKDLKEQEYERRDGPKYGDGNEVSKEAEKCHYKLEPNLHPHPAAAASFPEYSLPQYSNHFDCSSDSYRDATDNNWPLNHNYSTTPSCSPYQHSYPQPRALGSLVAHDRTYFHPQQGPLDNPLMLLNPELSASEGQTGEVSGPRCLTVIDTKRSPSERHLLQITRVLQHTGRQKWWRRPPKKQRCETPSSKPSEDSSQANTAEASLTCTSEVIVPQGEGDNPEAKESQEKKPHPTDEEIKANLRKKLQAFNQKAKQVKQFHHSEVMRPSDSLTFELS